MHPQTAGAGQKAEKTRAVLALLLTMFFWGTSAVFMRTTALTLTPENALALRYIVLVLMAVPGLQITGQWRIARQHWPRLILTGLGMFGSSWFTIQGFARVAAGLGTVISMVEPIIIALLFWAVLREPLSSRIWAGLSVSLAGSAVLFWPDITVSTANPVDRMGILFLLAAPSAGRSLPSAPSRCSRTITTRRSDTKLPLVVRQCDFSISISPRKTSGAERRATLGDGARGAGGDDLSHLAYRFQASRVFVHHERDCRVLASNPGSQSWR